MLRAYGVHTGIALAALVVASTSCSLSADLDSLTSGADKSPPMDAGVTVPEASSNGDDVECVFGACTSGASAVASTVSNEATPSAELDEPVFTMPDGGGASTWETLTPSDASSPAPSASETTSTRSEPLPTSTGETIDRGASSDEREVTCEQGSSCNSDAPLVHRYSFTNVTTTVTDSVGGADGAVDGSAVQGSGSFVFDGETHIELPTRVLAQRENVTLELWFTSYHTRNWERIFDAGDGDDGDVESYLFLTPQTPSANGTMRVTFRAAGEAEVTVDSAEETSDNVATHVAVVFDGSENRIRLYHDGELSASETTQGSLQDVNVAKVWLGRSLFDGDPLFEGEIDEFRIYDGLLSAERIRNSFQDGPDALVP